VLSDESQDSLGVVQQHREANRRNRPRPREVAISLDRAREARKQMIEGFLIGF
jgi:hypothetical protein